MILGVAPYHWLAVFCLVAVTWACRTGPFIFSHGKSFPQWLKKWLSSVPLSVLSAMVAVEILFPNGNSVVADGASMNYFIPTLGTILIAVASESLFLTMTVGILLAGFY